MSTMLIACASCGVKVTVQIPDVTEDPTDRTKEWWSKQRMREWEAHTASTGRCDACNSRMALAFDIADNVRGYRPLDYTNRVPAIVDAALAVFAALGQPLPDPTTFTTRDAPVLRELGQSGPSWDVERATDMSGKPKHADLAHPKPWEWVTDEHRGRLRSALGRFQALRLALGANPVNIAPPAGRACLWCGVGYVTVPAYVVARDGESETTVKVWNAHESGSLCKPCFAAVDRVNLSDGESRAKAALAAAGRGSAWVPGMTLDGWQDSGLDSPNDVPWAHADLSGFTDPPPLPRFVNVMHREF